MAAVTDSIGSGKDHETIVIFEASLNGHAGDDVTGEGYNEIYDEAVTIDDGTPDSITLSVAVGERHDGTAGTGARVVYTGAYIEALVRLDSTVATDIWWWEITPNDGNGRSPLYLVNSAILHTAHNVICHTCKVHSYGVIQAEGFTTGIKQVSNSFVYGAEGLFTATSVYGLRCGSAAGIDALFNNNTVFDVTRGESTTGAWCVGFLDNAATTIKNMIACDAEDADYNVAAPVNADVDYNLASDATASGANSLDNKAAADQFVSTAPVNLKLKAGADAIDEGVDLEQTPSGVEFDILNRDRHTLNDTWDMGAHEYVAVSGFVPYPYPRGANAGMSVMTGGMAE